MIVIHLESVELEETKTLKKSLQVFALVKMQLNKVLKVPKILWKCLHSSMPHVQQLQLQKSIHGGQFLDLLTLVEMQMSQVGQF